MKTVSTAEFVEFPKMGRLRRHAVITEKIDGTNAQISITDAAEEYLLGINFDRADSIVGNTHGLNVRVGSRTRWITPGNDNYGFARWVYDHLDEVVTLGVGRHFGEWWGKGIQRGYDVPDKRMSLFNVGRFCTEVTPNPPVSVEKPKILLPPSIGLVPVLAEGIFCDDLVNIAICRLKFEGSAASPGFLKPEGIIVYHTAAGVGFKLTLDNDGIPKSLVKPS